MAINYGLKLHPNSIELKVKQLEVLLDLERYVQARQLIDELEPSCSKVQIIWFVVPNIFLTTEILENL
jgi:hypothetical protein